MSRERGNILFLILIAVALFAALSFAITSTARTTGTDVSDEQARVAAAEITQYALSISSAVTRLLFRGCDVTNISFFHSAQPTGYEYINPNSPSNHSCDIFHTAGGNIAYRKPATNRGFYYSGGDWVGGIGTNGSELLMTVGLTSQNICEAINNGLGLPSPESAGMTGYFMGTDYRGIFNSYHAMFTSTSSPLYGAASACVKSVGGQIPYTWGSTYFYYHVLSVR